MHDDSATPRPDDRERQRDTPSLLGSGVGMPAPPIDRVLGDLVDGHTTAQQRRDDLA
jgi:hypothetical protein